jgi:Papain-like cysteine protease AvrRpt2
MSDSTQPRVETDEAGTVAAGASDAPEPQAAAAGWKRLPFVNELQEQTFWCWAALARNVTHFYDNTSTVTQCEIACAELNQTDCCEHGSSTSCNVYWFLSSALGRVGCLNRWSFSPPADLAAMKAEIDGNRPLCLRSARPDTGAHFLAVTGYLPDSSDLAGSEMLAVEDPQWGGDIVSFDHLLSGYREGTWSDTIYTQDGTP